jgi:Protein of unknown function (DUF2946)
MRGFRRHRTLIGWITVVALLGNVVGGLFCSASAKAGPFDYPPDLAAAMVICTEHGAQMLVPAGDDEKAPGKPCPLCLAAAAVALLLTFAAAWSLVPFPASRPIAFDFVPAFADSLRRAGLGSRAPPLSA